MEYVTRTAEGHYALMNFSATDINVEMLKELARQCNLLVEQDKTARKKAAQNELDEAVRHARENGLKIKAVTVGYETVYPDALVVVENK